MTEEDRAMLIQLLTEALEPTRTDITRKAKIMQALNLLGVKCSLGIWGWQVAGSQYDTHRPQDKS